jgi:hypothetical protein
MAPRKMKTEKLNDSKKKMGRPSSNPIKDTYLRLQTSFMKTQIMMVYDDSTIETPRSNEVEYMFNQCQKSIDDKKNA